MRSASDSGGMPTGPLPPMPVPPMPMPPMPAPNYNGARSGVVNMGADKNCGSEDKARWSKSGRLTSVPTREPPSAGSVEESVTAGSWKAPPLGNDSFESGRSDKKFSETSMDYYYGKTKKTSTRTASREAVAASSKKVSEAPRPP